MSTHRLDVVTAGESLGLLTADDVGSLCRVNRMRIGFGGAESNVAIGVARLGGTAAWIGRVGADALGELILRELRAEMVETHVTVDHDVSTALMLKERPRPAASRITYYRRGHAGSRLCPSDIPAEIIGRAGIVHVTGITAALGERPLAALHSVIDHAGRAGARISFDVNHRAGLWADTADAVLIYRDLITRAHIVFAGEDEAQLVTGEHDRQRQLDALLALGPDQVVVKCGSQGAVAATGTGTRLSRDAHRVTVVDTVGAGDAFVAGWLAESTRGSDLSSCLDVASACGALACTTPGDWEAAPTRADLALLADPGHDPVSR
ncbi:sugar kinase [Mycobacterium sp. 4D054]|uniref:sugar kinase n=1 Tax=unclassified Mycobacterium TaxID=2642494 RepID=UPI0021B1FCF6|nr:sugar kinase [Mycobacterium sp. SMC-8]